MHIKTTELCGKFRFLLHKKPQKREIFKVLQSAQNWEKKFTKHVL